MAHCLPSVSTRLLRISLQPSIRCKRHIGTQGPGAHCLSWFSRYRTTAGACTLAVQLVQSGHITAAKDRSSKALTHYAPGSLFAFCAQVLDNSRRLHLGDAADATRHAITGFASGLKAAFAFPFQRLQNAFKPSPSAPSELVERQPVQAERQPVQAERQPVTVERQPVMAERQPKAAVLEAGPLPAGATVRVSVRSSPGANGSLPVEATLAGIPGVLQHNVLKILRVT